jgi:peptidoglycan-associated lipoprotein
MRSRFLVQFAPILIVVLLSAGCAKKVAKATPPPPPAAQPPAPTATLAATPAAIQRGQSTQLTWHTSNATEITIAGIGTVASSGSRNVTPSESTTYELVAKGAGGTANADTRVTVTAPPVMQSSLSEQELFARNVKDVFFDYDKYNIRPDQEPITESDAKFLEQHPSVPIVVEGHCDDRGSDEYNLALGASRANAVKEQLVKEGVSADRIKTVSYGKEKPFCMVDDEPCWSQNRRDHIVGQLE